MSQLRSSRGAKAAKAKGGRRGATAAAAPRGGRGMYVQQAKNDIFVVLLGVALGAMLLGCLFMTLHLWGYEFEIGAPGV